MKTKASITPVIEYLKNLQQEISTAIANIDEKERFRVDNWQRDNIQATTMILTDGKVFERAGIGFSHVKGNKLPPSATIRNPQLKDCNFAATGVSLVIHPRNPYVPTTHANVRFFSAIDQTGKDVWWFGGGFDLTPFYPFLEDCQHWHKKAKEACDPFDENLYTKYKNWCDDYFYLKHRNETRGVGGLFFDDLNHWPFEKCFEFMKSVGNQFLPAYLPIVEKRKDHPYSQNQRDFQLYRRGRYVEFNLVYDRGTLFGLQSGGRAESILMSMPPLASWSYDWQPLKNSPEAELYEEYLKPREWLVNG